MRAAKTIENGFGLIVARSIGPLTLAAQQDGGGDETAQHP
jgi:hypothetical protein